MRSATDDKADILEARSNYNARKTESSIIEWICSPTWTDKRPFTENKNTRGSVHRFRLAQSHKPLIVLGNSISGEIVVGDATCLVIP